VALKHAQRLNGFSSIALTKLDVMSGLEELKVCVGYRTDSGVLDVWPGDAQSFNHVEPVYETLPGWSEELKGITDKELLPAEAKRYLSFIEEKLGVPISMVGVGPGRKETLVLTELPL
jgi:adenylosuccinate synthase